MIFGIGVDIVEIERMKKVLERSESSFIKKIFSENEIDRIPSPFKRKVEYVSGRFAGKEAVAKALGTGIGGKIGWKDIEILSDPSGKPTVTLKSVDTEMQNLTVHISISHSQSMAISKVIIEQI